MTRGLLPDVEDLAAIGILVITYLIRLVATDPDIEPPWFLYVATDLILPSLAGAWLFVATMFVLIRRVERIERGE